MCVRAPARAPATQAKRPSFQLASSRPRAAASMMRDTVAGSGPDRADPGLPGRALPRGGQRAGPGQKAPGCGARVRGGALVCTGHVRSSELPRAKTKEYHEMKNHIAGGEGRSLRAAEVTELGPGPVGGLPVEAS